MKRKKVKDVVFQMEKKEAEPLTSAEQLVFLVLPCVKYLADRYGNNSAFYPFSCGILNLNEYAGNLD